MKKLVVIFAAVAMNFATSQSAYCFDDKVFVEAIKFSRSELQFGQEDAQKFGQEMGEMGRVHYGAFLDTYSLIKEDAQKSLEIRSAWDGKSDYPISDKHADFLGHGATSSSGQNKALYTFVIYPSRLVEATNRVLRVTKAWDEEGPEAAEKSREGSTIFRNFYDFFKAKGYLTTLERNYKGVELPRYDDATSPSCLYSTVMQFAWKPNAKFDGLITIAESLMDGEDGIQDPVEALNHAFAAFDRPKAVVNQDNRSFDGCIGYACMAAPLYKEENDFGHLASPKLNYSEVQKLFIPYVHNPWY